jgi:hypothetical protein
MSCHTYGGKGHFKRECPNKKTMIVDAYGGYETGDDADPFEEEPVEVNEEIYYCDASPNPVSLPWHHTEQIPAAAPSQASQPATPVLSACSAGGADAFILMATNEDLREFCDTPSAMPLVLVYKGEILVSNDMTPLSIGVSFVLQEFRDVFLEEVPDGLPPLRGIEHQIDLIPGASLPNRAPYRTNPEETKEIQKQVQALLDNG